MIIKYKMKYDHIKQTRLKPTFLSPLYVAINAYVINYLTVNKYSQLRYRYGIYGYRYAKHNSTQFKSMFLIRISNNLLNYKIDQMNQISILSFYFFHFLPQNISARSFLPFSFRNIFPHYLFITCCFRTLTYTYLDCLL